MTRRLDLDYAHPAEPYPAKARLFALLGMLLLVGAVYALGQYFLWQTRQLQAENGHLLGGDAHSGRNLATQYEAAKQTAESLNFPWMQTLNALERAQQAQPSIHLLSVTPNRNRREITLLGETDNFDHLTGYLTTLQQATLFSDAVLQQQQIDENGQKIKFAILVRWQT